MPVLVLVALGLLLLSGCAVNPYLKGHQQYYSGDPGAAELTLAPVAEKEIAADGKWKNLYLWDMGVYQFNQGKYKEAVESLKASVADRERMYGTGETIKTVALKSASSSKYLGDPVEVSVAYLYMGFSYFLVGDFENCLVAFRRSAEEDLSKDEVRIGDMAITNYMMGESYLQTKGFDDAVVAFRRATASSPDFVPAYVGMLRAANQNHDRAAQEFARSELEKRVAPEYLALCDEHPNQGIVIVLSSEPPDAVTADMWLGAFRKRQEIKTVVDHWQLIAEPEHALALNQADHMHTHFKDQGGFEGEANRQMSKALVGQGLKAAGCGILAPSTDADVRYWSTMPGRFFVGYLPATSGTYGLSLRCFDKKNNELLKLSQQWPDVVVQEGQRTVLIVNSYVKAGTEQVRARI
jgi:tetratricopeptide (TPR) repeat protein